MGGGCGRASASGIGSSLVAVARRLRRRAWLEAGRPLGWGPWGMVGGVVGGVWSWGVSALWGLWLWVVVYFAAGVFWALVGELRGGQFGL